MKQKTTTLSLKERKQVFLALVEAQDGGMTVPQSKKAVAEKFGVSEQLVKIIEEEGLEREWPLL